MDPNKETQNEVKGLKKLVQKMIKNDKDSTKSNNPKIGINYKLIFFFLLWGFGMWQFTQKIGLLDYQWIANQIFSLLNLIITTFSQKSIDANTFRILGFIPIIFITTILGYLIAAIIAFDVYILVFYAYLSGSDNPQETIMNVLKKELSWVIAIIAIFLLLGTVTAALTVKDSEASPVDIGNEKLTEIQDSYMWCTLKNSLTDPTVCKKIQETKQAVESDKTKYEISMLDPPYGSYDYTQRNSVDFTYKFLTQGGYIKIDKFECYHTSKKEENLIGEPQIFENEVVKAHNALDQRTYKCDLSKLENPKDENQFKIIPVLYYTINSQITQEIPMVTIPESETPEQYFQAREKYKNAFESLTAVISNKVIGVKTRWSPMAPIITNDEEGNTEYQIFFTFEKSSIQQTADFGKIISSKLVNLKVPKRFDKNCGPYNLECTKELFTEDLGTTTKSHLELNLTLNDIPEDNLVEYVIIDIESQMELKKTKTIIFKNPSYVEPIIQTENKTITEVTTSTTTANYWEEAINYLTNLQTKTNNNKNSYSNVEKDCNTLLTLINEGFEVSREGRILETKAELTNNEQSRNLELKVSYSNIKTQITNLETKINNIINEEKQNTIEEYNGP